MRLTVDWLRPVFAANARLLPALRRVSALWSLFQGEAYGPFDTVIANLPWCSRPHLVTQTNHPLGDKTIAPQAHGETLWNGAASAGGQPRRIDCSKPLAHSRTMRARQRSSDRERPRFACSMLPQSYLICSG